MQNRVPEFLIHKTNFYLNRNYKNVNLYKNSQSSRNYIFLQNVKSYVTQNEERRFIIIPMLIDLYCPDKQSLEIVSPLKYFLPFRAALKRNCTVENNIIPDPTI